MNLTTEQILDYIAFLEAKHRDSYAKLKTAGKTYRSRLVSFERGYIIALSDVRDAIEEPLRSAELHKTLEKLAKRLKG